MESTVIKKLTQRFTAEQVRSREGPAGKRLEYVETHVVIARLNDALEADWDFEIVDHRILEKEVVVVGKITVHTHPMIIKTAFGSHDIKTDKQGQVISVGNDLKAASSDALKKCATLLGVGLHLYHRGNAPSVNEPSGNVGHGDGVLTSKQHGYIRRIAHECGMTEQHLESLVRQRFNKANVRALTKRQASELIGSLQQ